MDNIIHLDSERLLRFEQHQDAQDVALRDIKLRLANLEKGQAGIKSDIGHLYEILAAVQVSIDGTNETLGNKLDTIMRRMDLIE